MKKLDILYYASFAVAIGAMMIGLTANNPTVYEVSESSSVVQYEDAKQPEPAAARKTASTAPKKQSTTTAKKPKYSEDELFCMAAAIYNEAGSDACSDETRRLVGYVILNRVKDSRFPNTIRGVLEQRRQYGLFYITGVKFADRHTLPQEKEAVDRAYRIAKEVLELDKVPIPREVVFQAEFQQGTSIYKYQDGIYFCCS